MKPLRALLLLSLIVLTAGCVIGPTKIPIQEILTNLLPPDFEGSYHLEHDNAAVQVDIHFTGLKRNANGLWTWTGMVYKGHSPWTTTKATAAPNTK